MANMRAAALTSGLTSDERFDQMAARDHEADHAAAVRLAHAILGRDGSHWHDIDQRLARAVLRLELRGKT